MHRYRGAWYLIPLLLALCILSCDIPADGDKEKGSGAPGSFSRKMLLEIASCAADAESDLGEEIASRLTSGIEAYRNKVFAASFHIDDPLALAPPKTSELTELCDDYIDGVLRSIGEIPVASINRQPLDGAFYSLFIGCSRWEEEMGRLLPLGAANGQASYGLKIETSWDELAIHAAVYVGFAEKPLKNHFVTLFITEDGVELFRKGTGYCTFNSVVRSLMKPPSGGYCPFGYPLYAGTIDAGEYVKLEFGLPFDEMVFEERENLKILAVLHETWRWDEEGNMIPGPVINAQQVRPGHTADWD